MIEATWPEPIVRPPSRFVGSKIIVFFYIFSMDFYSYYSIFHLVFAVLKFFRTKIEPRTKLEIIILTLYNPTLLELSLDTLDYNQATFPCVHYQVLSKSFSFHHYVLNHIFLAP